MTAARQQRKTPRPRFGPYIGAVLRLLLAAPWAAAVSHAAITERIVADRHTGLAMNGFDPVAYFVDGAPAFGLPEIEHTAGGVTWRFRNVGNREAFIQRPDVYMPRFGGYDPVGIARGVAVPGNPLLWRISEARLYLFYDRAALDAFAARPDDVIDAAERNWPEIMSALPH